MFQVIHIHTTVINSGRAHTTQYRTHCGLWLWLQSWLMPQSPHCLRNDLKCVEWDVKPCSVTPVDNIWAVAIYWNATKMPGLQKCHSCEPAPHSVENCPKTSFQPSAESVYWEVVIEEGRYCRLVDYLTLGLLVFFLNTGQFVWLIIV